MKSSTFRLYSRRKKISIIDCTRKWALSRARHRRPRSRRWGWRVARKGVWRKAAVL